MKKELITIYNKVTVAGTFIHEFYRTCKENQIYCLSYVNGRLTHSNIMTKKEYNKKCELLESALYSILKKDGIIS